MNKLVYFLFLLTVSITFFALKRDFNVVYGDSGFMWIQIMDIIHSNFSTLTFQYGGKNFDLVGNYAPFINPFLGKVSGNLYIVFPPYYPLVMSFFRSIWNDNIVIYLVQLLAQSISIFYLYLLLKQISQKPLFAFFASLIYFYGTTVFSYNLVMHEYSIALAFMYSGFYYLNQNNNRSLLISGFLFGISLFFRLELMIVISISVFFTFVLKWKYNFKLLIRFLPGLIFLLFAFFYLNWYLHGHPLGLRYTLTFSDPINKTYTRGMIIYEVLFGKLRGFYYQSPFIFLTTILTPIIIFFDRAKNFVKSDWVYFASIFYTSLFVIILVSPNHGDHISPRYLFGLYPMIFPLSLLLFLRIRESTSQIRRYTFFVCFLFTILFSFGQFFKTMSFIKKSDKNIVLLNELVENRPEKNILFLDQALPKNLQTIFFKKNFYYTAKIRNVNDFLYASKLNPRDIMVMSSEFKENCIPGTIFCLAGERFTSIGIFTATGK